MAQDVMIRDSNISFYNINARGPIATPLELKNNVTRFNEAQQSIYGGPSIYGDQPGFNFGFRQPFVWVSPYDSDFDKYIKKFDSQAFPIGSTAQDVQRIGKLLVSGKGIFFTATQFLLQSQQAFNETNLYNPLSIVQSVARPASLGLLPRINRHFNQDNLLASFGFSGGGDVPAPNGTAGKNTLSKESRADGATGLIRSRTANRALLKFNFKWTASRPQQQSIFDQLLSNFAPGLLQSPKPMETYRADDRTYDVMIKDNQNYNGRLNSAFDVRGIPSSKPFTTSFNSPLPFKQPYYNLGNGNSRTYTQVSIDQLRKAMEEIVGGGKGEIPSSSPYNIPDSSTTVNPSGGKDPVNGYQKTYKSKTKYPTDKSLTDIGLSSPNGNNSVRSLNDIINSSTIRSAPTGGTGNNTPDPTADPDLIPFLFYDVVNARLVQFHATLTGINVGNTAEWENIRYLGRADQVYIYRGFNRSLSFNFSIYANNEKELDNVWTKANYLTGLVQPSKYTGGTDGFIIVPPFLKITIGNLFKNQPIILKSAGLSLKDEGGWVLDDGRQLPMFADISIDCDLLEINKPQTELPHYGFTLQPTEDQSVLNNAQATSVAPSTAIDIAQLGAPADSAIQLLNFDLNTLISADASNLFNTSVPSLQTQSPPPPLNSVASVQQELDDSFANLAALSTKIKANTATLEASLVGGT